MDNKEEIGFLVHRIDKTIKANMDNELSKHDLTFSQSQVLRHIQKNKGTISQKKLQELMNVSHPTIVGLVQRLEAKGYVETSIDPEDRRSKIVRTTDLADKFKKDLISSRQRFDKKMLKGLNEEELDELYRMLDHMYSNIS